MFLNAIFLKSVYNTLPVAVREILRTAEIEKRKAMMALINEYNVILFQNISEANSLADVYVREHCSAKIFHDALHIAGETVLLARRGVMSETV